MPFEFEQQRESLLSIKIVVDNENSPRGRFSGTSVLSGVVRRRMRCDCIRKRQVHDEFAALILAFAQHRHFAFVQLNQAAYERKSNAKAALRMRRARLLNTREQIEELRQRL